MFSQHFGHYLLDKGYLLSEQLCEVLTYERAVRAKLGVLAIDAGMMSVEQVDRVHDLQHRTDKKFGEIALEQKYLTSDQLEALLASQSERRVSLSQILLDRGYLTEQQLDNALKNYKDESQLPGIPECTYQADFVGVGENFFSIPCTAGRDEEIFRHYTALMMRNFQRFLGEEPVIDISGDQVGGWMVYQHMSGDFGLLTGLRMEENVLLELAQHYSGETFAVVDDFAKDCIAEFLNETNGVFAVNMSNRGMEMDLKPQQIREGACVPLQGGCRIPLRISKGQVDLIIAMH